MASPAVSDGTSSGSGGWIVEPEQRRVSTAPQVAPSEAAGIASDASPLAAQRPASTVVHQADDDQDNSDWDSSFSDDTSDSSSSDGEISGFHATSDIAAVRERKPEEQDRDDDDDDGSDAISGRVWTNTQRATTAGKLSTTTADQGLPSIPLVVLLSLSLGVILSLFTSLLTHRDMPSFLTRVLEHERRIIWLIATLLAPFLMVHDRAVLRLLINFSIAKLAMTCATFWLRCSLFATYDQWFHAIGFVAVLPFTLRVPARDVMFTSCVSLLLLAVTAVCNLP